MKGTSSMFIMSVGISFLVLAFSRATGTFIEPKFIISFSIAGLFFTVGDVISFSLDILQKRTSKEMVIKIYEYLYLCVNAAGVLSIMALPHVKDWSIYDGATLALISDVSMLTSLGLVILLIGSKDFITLKITEKVIAVFG